MNRKRWKWLLISLGTAALLLWGYDRVYMIHWVGHTDLEVEFIVTDSASGTRIPDASIEVQSQGGFYEEDFKQEFSLVSDQDGIAHKVCKRSMCFGTQSGLRYTDTFVVHLPYWYFRAKADGYKSGEFEDLDVIEWIRKTKRSGPGKAKLTVLVSLHRQN